MLTKLIQWVRSEPAMVRAGGTFIAGAAGAAGLTVTSQQEGAIVSGVMAVLAIVQGWRTRAKVSSPVTVAKLESAGAAAVANALDHGLHPAQLMTYLDLPDAAPAPDVPPAA